MIVCFVPGSVDSVPARRKYIYEHIFASPCVYWGYAFYLVSSILSPFLFCLSHSLQFCTDKVRR